MVAAGAWRGHPAAVRVKQAWVSLRRHLDRLRALDPAYAGFEPGGAHGRPALLEPLRRLCAALAGMVRTTLKAEDKEHLREWHA